MANEQRIAAHRTLGSRGLPAAMLAVSALLLACSEAGVPTDAASSSMIGDIVLANAASATAVSDGQYIVTFADSVSDVPGLARAMSAQYGASPLYTYTTAMKGFAARLPAHALDALQRNPRVASIEPDEIVEMGGTQSGAPWGLDRIDQRALPLDASYSFSSSGSGVNAYIIDTGIRASHADFGGRATGGYTAIADGLGTGDCNGHGTHVAGTVGGARFGVAKAVRLYAVRVAGCTGTGATSALLSGLDWVARNRVLPAVANISLEAGLSSTLNSAAQAVINAGVVVVVAAGNDAGNACNYSPGSTPSAVTVGASASFDAMSGFSNSGSCVDLFAPGQNIVSASYANDTASVVMSGTSMAAPHAAGVAALYLSTNPTADPATVAGALVGGATAGALSSIPAGTANLLLYSLAAPPVSSPPPADTTTPPPPSPTPTPVVDQPPVASFTSNCPRGKCTFDGSGSTDDKGIATFTWNFGDGTAASSGSTLMKVSHVYTAAGGYTVTLTVTDGAGQKASKATTLVFKKV
jgi:serine protease